MTDDFEIVMVDDGSPDNSLEIACAIVAQGQPRPRRRAVAQLRSPQGDDDGARSCARRPCAS